MLLDNAFDYGIYIYLILVFNNFHKEKHFIRQFLQFESYSIVKTEYIKYVSMNKPL